MGSRGFFGKYGDRVCEVFFFRVFLLVKQRPADINGSSSGNGDSRSDGGSVRDESLDASSMACFILISALTGADESVRVGCKDGRSAFFDSDGRLLLGRGGLALKCWLLTMGMKWRTKRAIVKFQLRYSENSK